MPATPRPPLRESLRFHAPAVAAVAAGGVIGTLGRYGLTLAIPPRPGQFDWATFLANTAGGLLVGAVMVIVIEAIPRQRLLRPFIGVGVLGGFTTFSTYIVDIGRALDAGDAALAALYAAATLAAALAAAAIGLRTTRRLLRKRTR